MRYVRALLFSTCCLTLACVGDAGTNGFTTLVTTTAELPGANCADGGQRLDIGVDDSRDGVLDADEVDTTSYVCSVAGAATLVSTADEAAGENCVEGGQRVDVGVDDSGDGVLDADEVDTTTYVCNGATGGSGAATLALTTSEAAGTNCATGGQRVDVGVDDNGDGTLDAIEIDATTYICNGVDAAASLVAISPEPAGANCAEGGQRIDAGVDDNGDGTLDAIEIDSTSYICNGADGLSSRITTTDEPAGANCSSGGQRIDVGVDTNGDGTLDAAEIDQTSYICNGSSTTGSARYLYLANWAGFNSNFNIYDLATNTWSVGAALPSPSGGNLASTGSAIRIFGTDGNIYEYNLASNTWALVMAGPSGISRLAFFRILNGNMYVCQANTTTMHIYSGGAWSTLSLSASCSVAGGKDPVSNEIYVKTYGTAGFTVIDATTNTVARTVTDAQTIAENTSSAAFSGSNFYTRSNLGNIFSLDGLTGAKVDTGADPGGAYAGFYTDEFTGEIYMLSMAGFSSYDPATATFTALTAGPTESTLATVALTY